MSKSKDAKYAVYLSVLDWQIVMAALLWHCENRVERDNPLWTAGKNRAMHIVGEIAEKLPKSAPATTP